VVNNPSLYNLPLGRPSLNKLGVAVASVHLKVKFPTLEEKHCDLEGRLEDNLEVLHSAKYLPCCPYIRCQYFGPQPKYL